LVSPGRLPLVRSPTMSDRAKHDKVMPANRLLAGADQRKAASPLRAALQFRHAGGDRGG
jgi:hypothetical protein